MLTPNNFPLSTFRFPLDYTLRFSYPDRTDSSARDFDCEAFVAADTALILFTKQWLSQGSSCYSIPTTGIIHLPSQGVKAVAVFDMQGHK